MRQPAAAAMAGVAAAKRLASLRVDHLVYAVPGRLEDACADFARRTGVTPSPGGVHKGLGTHNALAALGGGAYLEILARDPGQPDPERTWMAIDTVTEPCIVAWASKHADLSAAVDEARSQGYNPGDVDSFSRPDPDSGEELRWELAYAHYKQPLPGGGVVPFLISCESVSSRSSGHAPGWLAAALAVHSVSHLPHLRCPDTAIHIQILRRAQGVTVCLADVCICTTILVRVCVDCIPRGSCVRGVPAAKHSSGWLHAAWPARGEPDTRRGRTGASWG